MPVPYDKKDIKIKTYIDGDKRPVTGKTNKETLQFMKNRFVVLKNFVPKDVIDLTMDSWKTFEANPQMMNVVMTRETDIIQQSPEDSLRKSTGGHSFPPAVAMHRYIWEKLKGVIDLDLKETYAYSRKYERGAYLKAHTDRPSCEVSVTMCLDYKTDDGTPWKIWVQPDRDYVDEAGDQERIYNITQNKPHKQRKEDGAICVSLEVGDILLYQGPNIPHWRDYFVGEYSYHMFLHYYNVGGRITTLPFGSTEVKKGMPDQIGVLDFDGRGDRYEGCSGYRREAFDKFSKFWNAKNAGDPQYDEVKFSEHINYYDHIEVDDR